MTHVLHECPNMPKGLLESLQENYGYPEDETRMPLNTDNKENCPYCGVKLEVTNEPQNIKVENRFNGEMEDKEIKVDVANSKLVRMLSQRPRK